MRTLRNQIHGLTQQLKVSSCKEKDIHGRKTAFNHSTVKHGNDKRRGECLTVSVGACSTIETPLRQKGVSRDQTSVDPKAVGALPGQVGEKSYYIP